MPNDRIAVPPVESPLVRTLLAGRFAITAEITPPVAGAAAPLIAQVEPLRGLADAVNVTDGPRAKVHMSALAAAAILVAHGVDPILQLTCRDRNRIALQSDLLGAGALGVRNLLILRGDDPDPADIPPAKAVFDMDSRELTHIAAKMRDGQAMASGREIVAPPRFFIGAADTPIDPPADWRPTGLLRKVEAGSQFVQTQLCYDIGVVRRYIARLVDTGLTDRVFVLIGTGPVASARSARWMRDNLYGVVMPDSLVERLEKATDPKAEGIRFCAEFLQQLKEIRGVAGAHLMAPGNMSSIPPAIRLSGLHG
ncbi:MAG: methylenetetrahydrofolate reductase [Rhodospirillales bacterium]